MSTGSPRGSVSLVTGRPAPPMALLALEDGTLFEGEPFGAPGTVFGEVVFNTGLTGYVEVLTDPSYRGQLVAMTQPHIGNYGVTYDDLESYEPHVAGFMVREASPLYSNWRAQASLEDFLVKFGIVGITGVDTRALARHIRHVGAMRGCLSSEDAEPDGLIDRARSAPTISEVDLVAQVTCREIHAWDDPSDPRWADAPDSEAGDLHVVAFDFGIKHNILRRLRDRVRRITVVPADTSAERVRRLKPDGIFLSNGPGDPERVDYVIRTIGKLLDVDIPVFGICLGHQLLGLALGARSYKLKFGHRGSNQPVKHLETGRVEVTTHNHGFALRDLPSDLEVTHLNLNDGTVEGMRLVDGSAFSVQYHPEAAPGPHDSHYLFERFIQQMRDHAGEA